MYKRGESLRNRGARIRSPEILMGIIFDENILPEHLFGFKKAYIGRILLSMARREFKKHNYREAHVLFHKAFY